MGGGGGGGVLEKSHISKSVSVCTSSSEMEVAVQQHHQDWLQLAVEYARHRRRLRMRRAIWVKPWIGRRCQFGLYDQLMIELRNKDQRAFRTFLRMPPEMYD